MFAGNLKSSNKYDNYFFYWVFPNIDMASDQPIILYMNGGPGSTSMNALFTENGPLRTVQRDKADNDSFEIWYEPQDSWASVGTLLFVDQPVGTGWSWGEKSAESLEEVGADFVTFILNLYGELPWLSGKELIITGESFAGKYLSYISKAILDHN